jgi:hypothetical protein
MRHAESGTTAVSPVAAYVKSQSPASVAICDKLQAEIDRAIPKATSRMWHGGPVWLIGENPVVGYQAGPKRVDLTFWSVQLFEEPLLKAVGKDKAAQVSFRDESEIKLAELRRWLKSARTMVFDYAEMYAQKRKTAGLKPQKRA